jgi:hypothetical protein
LLTERNVAVGRSITSTAIAKSKGFIEMVNAARFMGLAAAVVAVTAGHASASTPGVRFTSMPGHVVQGTNAQVAVSVKSSAVRCSLAVRYANGAAELGIQRALTRLGSAWSWTWTWSVPITVQAGSARADVHCGRAGSFSRRFVVVGKLAAPKIVVTKSGWSTRPQTGGGTRLSYGLILHNTSDTQDASSLTVQTNFVLGDDHLLGTDTRTVPGIGAGGDFALGNTVTFPGLAPIVRLEVVVQVHEFAPHSLHLPTLANIHLVPGVLKPEWLGSIEGEIQNTDPSLTLGSAALSAVVLDANGAILGGTWGYSSGSLPPGARAFLKLTGVDVIPTASAATAIVSASPTWQQPGS